MSDTLSAIGSLVSLITGGAPVALGSFDFQSFEVPERVQSGGSHRMTVHRFPGGGRTFDVMGRDDVAVSWSGTLLGGNALSRKSQLNAIRIGGQAQELFWGNQNLSVIVRECTFDEGFNRIEYRITCEVLADTATSQPSLAQSLLGDVGRALGLDLSGGLSAAANGLQQVQGVLQGLSGVIPGAGANLGLSTVLGKVQSISQGVSAAANGNLAGLGAAFNVGGLSSLVSAAGAAANSSAVASLVGRAQALLA